jgi:hypothetical protein
VAARKLAPLLPRPRRVRNNPGPKYATALHPAALHLAAVAARKLAPLLPRPRRVRNNPGPKYATALHPAALHLAAVAARKLAPLLPRPRRVRLEQNPDFEEAAIPESGKAIPVLVSSPPFSSPLCTVPGRAPVPPQLVRTGAGGPGRGPRLLDAAGGVGPGCVGRIPARTRGVGTA